MVGPRAGPVCMVFVETLFANWSEMGWGGLGYSQRLKVIMIVRYILYLSTQPIR